MGGIFEVRVIEDNTVIVLDGIKTDLVAALAECGLQCEKYAKGGCPVDTGRLRNSITNQVSEPEKSVYIGTNVEYGKYVELGTFKMKERPFLRNAANGHSVEYKQIFKKHLGS